MLLDIVHDLCLLIADVKSPRYPVPRGSKGGVVFVRCSMALVGPFIENNSSLPTDQLQHEHE